jgi:HD-like signal output (HDOD) protein
VQEAADIALVAGASEEITMQNLALMELVDEVRDLPLTVSDVLAQVIQECDNADASVSSLAQIMARDQALAAMVLKLGNSAYYGYARRIESLPDAVVLLGFASVKNLAITASITRLLSADNDDLAETRFALFDHSLAAATASRILGRSRRVSGEKAFVGGLLHDLGLIVLACYRKDAFRELLALRESQVCHIHECEEEILGFAHAELGALVAAEWKFPPALCEALRYHHTPELAVVDPVLAAAVHCGDWVAKHAGLGLASPLVDEWPHAATRAEFGITESSVSQLEAEVRAEFLDGSTLRRAA